MTKTTEDKKQSIRQILRSQRIIARHIPKRTGLVTDINHIMGGGMHENAIRAYVVPKMEKSNNFVNVLTPDEQTTLEEAMGLEHNALSIYKRPIENNFWSNANPTGMGTVTLRKGDNIFDLSKPTDYIAVKILLANKDKVCSSLEELQDRPKATYEYVLIKEGEEAKSASDNTSITLEAAMILGKIKEQVDIMRLILETIEGKRFAKNTSKEWMQTRALDLIKSSPKNARLFLSIAQDPLLAIKVLIRRAITEAIISDRGGYLYIKEGNVPMCESGEEPTMSSAARWLSKPQQATLLSSIQEKIKNTKD